MRLIERVDLLVDRTVGRMLDFELGWVRGRRRLAKNRTVQFGRSDIVEGMSRWRCFWLTTSWRAGPWQSSESAARAVKSRGFSLLGVTVGRGVRRKTSLKQSTRVG
jgi:hypothetical protein